MHVRAAHLASCCIAVTHSIVAADRLTSPQSHAAAHMLRLQERAERQQAEAERKAKLQLQQAAREQAARKAAQAKRTAASTESTGW
jgi:hypothetical protein